MRRLFRGAVLAGIALLLGITALPLGLGERLDSIVVRSTQVFSAGKRAQMEIVLPEIRVYALQLGVFDDEARASAEAQRLEKQGILCMIWQKEKYRLIADIALKREDIDYAAAKGREAYVIEELLEPVCLRIEAEEEEIGEVCTLLQLPDESLARLIDGKTIGDEIVCIRAAAHAAANTHPEHALYTTLAENLTAWCNVMEKPESINARGYGAAAMFVLCRELRQALIASSTASAQRTPSTAADVMPPA